VEALHVGREPEDGRPRGGGVGPDALEDARAVVEGVGEHVDLGVGPVDELAVHPDLLGRCDRHGARSFAVAFVAVAGDGR
jgi:hypothetical protein